MKGLRAAITAVGLLFLLGISYPLVTFVSDLMQGGSKIYMKQVGDDIVINFDYRGRVELTNVYMSVEFQGSGGILNKSSTTDVMNNGSRLTIEVPVKKLPSNVKEISLSLRARIGGIFPLFIARTVKLGEGHEH
ncbi:MAG: hypothetical protein DRN78_05025 [Thermoproteota archaeon]|nr:MAG: hypothetical protein DRN78_05025 [Candidatus Korarchaeota archaeon]